MPRRRFRLLLAVTALILLASEAGCGGVASINVTPQPTLAVRTQPSVTRPAMLIQFCNDDTGSYPRGDFVGAAQLIATSLQQAVSANQQGVTLFATAITHNTFDPANTLDPAFIVPSIPAYPVPPTPVPTHAPSNPVTDPATATAVSRETSSSILAYNAQVSSVDQVVQQATAGITQDAQRLTSWNPPIDATATSIYGCFQVAASRFQGRPGVKMVYIASDLENNTSVDYTQNFVTSHGLAGAIVHVIFFYSESGQRDQQKRAEWCPFLKSAGARAVLFTDPHASPTLSDVFNTDLSVGEQPCS